MSDDIRYAVTLSELPPPDGWLPIWLVEEIDREWNFRRRHYFAQSRPAADCYAEVLVENLASPLADKVLNLWLILVEEEHSGPLTRLLTPTERSVDLPVFAGEIAGFEGSVEVDLDDDGDDDDDRLDVQDYLNGAYSSTLCSTSDPDRMRLRLKRPTPQELLANTPLYPRYRLVCTVREVGEILEIEAWLHNAEITYRFYEQRTTDDEVRTTYFLWRQADVTRFLTWAAERFPGVSITRDQER